MPKIAVQNKQAPTVLASRNSNSTSPKLNRVLFGGAISNSRASDVGKVVLRVVAGFSLMYGHGLGKLPPSDRFIAGVGEMGLPFPHFFGWMATFAEVGGAMLLAFGLFTRPVGFLLTGHFLIIALVAHAGADFGTRERAILYGAVAVFYLLSGAGRYSLDALVRRGNS